MNNSKKCICNNDCKCHDNCKENKCELNLNNIVVNINNYNCDNPDDCPSKFKTCIKASENSKPKIPISEKVDFELKNTQVPSVLGGYILKCLRRFFDGEKPFDNLEESIFNILKNSTPANLSCLQCALNNTKKLTLEENNKLFNKNLNGNNPIEINALRDLLNDETLQRLALSTGSSLNCPSTGVAGKARPTPSFDPNSNLLVLYANIFSINNLRTSQYVPKLIYSDYKSEEFDYDCSYTAACYPRSCLYTNENPTDCCRGDSIYSPVNFPFIPTPSDLYFRTCLAIPKVNVGDDVILKGVNFVDPNPKIKIELNSPDGIIYKYIDATVCGDLLTPVYETIDGKQSVIKDNRVNDTLKFTIPNDLVFGLYKFTVVFNNNTEIPIPEILETNPLYFEILPSSESTFKVSLVEFVCFDETDPEWAGSDEVQTTITTVPFYPDKEVGNRINVYFEQENIDSGNYFDRNDVLFEGNNFVGLSINISAHEVDRIAQYRPAALNQEIINEIIKNLYGVEKLTRQIIEVGSTIGLGYAVYYGFKSLVDFLDADPLIRDSVFLTPYDLIKLTTTGYPKYGIKEYTFDGIKVKSQVISSPDDKSCIEQRDYYAEDSHYALFIKYERL